MLPRGRAKGRQFVGILNFAKDFCQKPLCQDNMYVDIQVIYFLYFVSPGGGGEGALEQAFFIEPYLNPLDIRNTTSLSHPPPPPPHNLRKENNNIFQEYYMCNHV